MNIRNRGPIVEAAAFALLLFAGAGSLSALSATDILHRMDQNQDFRSIAYSATMIIRSGQSVRTKTMTATAVGTSKALVEFTNPEDRGTKYLKLDQNLWIYFPSEQDTVKISGHMLSQGMMGSDMSYQDALESGELEQKYGVALSGNDTIEGRPCYVLTLTAKVRDAQYATRKVWVDAERYVSLREEMYAKSGLLLKTSRTLAVEQIDGRWFPTKVDMSDKLKESSTTEFDMTNVAFDVPTNNSMFTLRNLER
ncbi:MAG TPA: outer membrane lipoprotein-sorting protein [Spirochaetia bacterium]|nr:outer membrane lipoprotein-sorting protein [Spirochaetia bacterium]HUZ16856.1 outer membrane lipoprotein-sorting protein [Spirochaetia bacterium]